MRFTVFTKPFEIAVCYGTFWIIRNFYSGDAHHANYGKHSLNHHCRYCANCVYQIYSVFKLFEIAICFAHFGFYEISTPVMRTMLTMQNVVYYGLPFVKKFRYSLCLETILNRNHFEISESFRTFRNHFGNGRNHFEIFRNYFERNLVSKSSQKSLGPRWIWKTMDPAG